MWFTSARCSYWRIRMSWSANFRYNWCNSALWTFLYHSPYPNYHTLTSKWAFKRVLKILFTPIPGTHQNHVYRPPSRVLANHHPSSYLCQSHFPCVKWENPLFYFLCCFRKRSLFGPGQRNHMLCPVPFSPHFLWFLLIEWMCRDCCMLIPFSFLRSFTYYYTTWTCVDGVGGGLATTVN